MRTALLMLTVFVLAGCASSSPSPEINRYLLRAEASLPDGEQNAPVNIGIGRVALASYLDQSGIVLQTGPDEIRPARQHLWAEPLGEGIRIYLRDAMSSELGYPVSADTANRLNWNYRVDVVIDQLHGSLQGDVTIDASWKLLDVSADKTLGQFRFRRNVAQPEEGYDSLVTTQKALLNELAAAIAVSFTNMQTG